MMTMMMTMMMQMKMEDDWEKAEEEDDWDPDFDEFDVPKSEAKKTRLAKKVVRKKKTILKIDDDFKDLGFDDLDGGGG